VTGQFLRGFLDGSLSILGIVIGASAASSAIIIAAALGGALTAGIANLLSALSAEEVEQYKELRRIEDAMVSVELKGSQLDTQISKRTAKVGAIDGLGTVIGGSIPILPYLFLPSFEAMIVAIGVVIVMVSFLGIYMGKVSRKNIAFSALKMVTFTAAVAAVVYLVQALIVPDSG